MKLVPAGINTSLVGRYVGEQVGAEFDDGMYQAFAVLSDTDEFMGGVIVYAYEGFDCKVAVAGETPHIWQDECVGGVFEYIFNQLQCVRCTCLCKKSNKRSRSLLEHLGFRLEGTMRLGYDGVKDALIYGLLASECRYLEGFDDGQGSQGTDSTGPQSDGSDAASDEQGYRDSQRGDEPDKPVHAGRLFDF